MAITTYISLDVALTISSTFEPGNPKNSLHSIALFVFTSIWPGAYVFLPVMRLYSSPDVNSAALLYFILMGWVVIAVLREMRPLIYYALAGLLFILAQLAYFLLSRPLCSASKAKVDGSFIATMLETASVFVIYLAWRSITEGTPLPTSYASFVDASSQIIGVRMNITRITRIECILQDLSHC
jgi:hypothetical protein